MYCGVDKELFIQEDYQVLHGAEDFCLDTEGPIGFAQFHQGSQYVLGKIRLVRTKRNIQKMDIPFLRRYSKQAPVALVESQLGTAGYAHWGVRLTLPPYASTPKLTSLP